MTSRREPSENVGGHDELLASATGRRRSGARGRRRAGRASGRSRGRPSPPTAIQREQGGGLGRAGGEPLAALVGDLAGRLEEDQAPRRVGAVGPAAEGVAGQGERGRSAGSSPRRLSRKPPLPLMLPWHGPDVAAGLREQGRDVEPVARRADWPRLADLDRGLGADRPSTSTRRVARPSLEAGSRRSARPRRRPAGSTAIASRVAVTIPGRAVGLVERDGDLLASLGPVQRRSTAGSTRIVGGSARAVDDRGATRIKPNETSRMPRVRATGWTSRTPWDSVSAWRDGVSRSVGWSSKSHHRSPGRGGQAMASDVVAEKRRRAAW